MSDLISIIVPCYNVASYLSDFLMSMEKINYPNYEIILIDDGSKDETGNILDKFALTHKFAKVFHQTNGGVSAARNRGLQEAQGKYITFADPDDYVHPDILTILYNAIVKTDTDVSSCGYKLVNENSHYSQTNKKVKISGLHVVTGKDNILCHLLSLISITIWNRLFKKEILEKIPNYPNLFNLNNKHGDDSQFCILYFLYANSFSYVSNKLYYWRMRNTSITHANVKSDDTNFFVCENFLKEKITNNSVYQKSQIYIHASFCLWDMGIINIISHSLNYHNPDFAKLVYKKYCEELPYVKKAKLFPLAYRFGTMFTKPFMYLTIRKKMKG